MKETRTQALNTVEAGRTGIVTAVKGNNELQKRLISMGLHVGDEIKVLHQGQDATPMLIVVGDTRLALGQDTAEQILLTPLSCERPSWGALKDRLKHYIKKRHHGGHHEKKFGRFRGRQHGEDYRIRERKLGVS